MLYFAELKGKHIKTPDGGSVGRLTDILFLAKGQPQVTKLVIRNKADDKIIIPISSIKLMNGAITLIPGYQTVEQETGELSLVKNLMDKQIIDIRGNKIVRVNDVVIQEKPYFVVAGVDVGFMGILRWLCLEQLVNKYIHMVFLGRPVLSKFLPWDDIQPVELSRGKVVVKHEEAKLKRLAPEDLADHLEKLSIRNISKILELLDEEREAEVIQNLNVNYQKALFKHFKPEHCAEILALVDPDEAVDILLTLSVKRRETICTFLPEEKKQELEYLLSLSHTPIGELITTEYMTVEPEDTAKKCIKMIKNTTKNVSWLSYVYVTNKRKELVGVFSLHELLVQEPDTPVYKFMTPQVIVTHLTTPTEIAIKKMLKFNIYGIPVINDKKEMLGIITIDDLIEEIREKFI